MHVNSGLRHLVSAHLIGHDRGPELLKEGGHFSRVSQSVRMPWP